MHVIRFVLRLKKEKSFNVVHNCKRLYSNDFQTKIEKLNSFINDNNAEAVNIFIKKNLRNSKDVNNALLVKYLRYVNNQPINEKTETIISLCYESLKKKYKVLDPITAENCAVSLSKTKHWKIGIDLLDDMKIIGNPSRNCILSLIKAAFEHYEYDIGWKLFYSENIDGLQIDGIEEPFLSLMKSIKSQNNYKEFENFLKFAREQCILVNGTVANEIKAFLKMTRNNECFDTNINNLNNLCNICENHLKKYLIQEDEFSKLMENFYQAVILGNDVYSKTTPDEVMKFLDLLKNKGPWNLVIDGLNMGYIKGKQKENQIYAQNIERVLNYFLEKRKKILLLGRHHMYFWLRDILPRIRLKATLFFVENLSQDDPFLLYAAMSSGLRTEFVSRDLMRSHLDLLPNKNLKLTFKKWQQLHQYSIDNNGVIIEPARYLITTQQTDDYWHLPYFDSKIKWLCFKFNSSQ